MTAKIIGCIHFLPIPGSSGYAFNKEEHRNKALCERELYKDADIDKDRACEFMRFIRK